MNEEILNDWAIKREVVFYLEHKIYNKKTLLKGELELLIELMGFVDAHNKEAFELFYDEVYCVHCGDYSSSSFDPDSCMGCKMEYVNHEKLVREFIAERKNIN